MKSHTLGKPTLRKTGAIIACCLLDFVLLSLKQTGFLLITTVVFVYWQALARPTSSSISVCAAFHMVASLMAHWRVERVKRPLPPTCNESNTELPVCLHN